MFVRKEVLFLILGLTISRTVAQVTCSDNFQLISGNVGVLFCNYDPSFISVRWYKDNSKVPAAVIERGKRIVSGGYDIADNGTLIISKVSVQHEGTYRISVLDGNGDIESQNVTAFVIVPLSEEPLIQTCSSSGSKECMRFSEEEKGNVLICESKETRPAVDFIWTNLVSNEAVTVNGAITNTVMNASTSLYSSFSTLRFNPNDFSLQLFTCNATGKAVNTPMASSLLVTGLRDVVIIEKGHKMIEQGEIITIDCPKSNFALGTLQVIHTDGTRRTLATFSAGSYDLFCKPETRCTVSEKGKITINDVTFQDEGVYECVCSDGVADGKYLSNVDTLIKPAPEKIVIEGCKYSSNCEKAVALTGTIQASVNGARPSVELTCVPADQSTAFLYNHQSQVRNHPDEGTSDTFYSIDFDIDECSAPVHIVCMVIPGTAHENLNVSNIFLITDTSTCEKGNTSLAIVLVISFIIILVITATFILYIKREQVTSLRDQCFPHKAKEPGCHYDPVPLSDVEPPKVDANQDEHNSQFEDLYGKIQTEKISQDDFREEMEEFSKTKNENLPQSFLSFIMKKDFESNEPWKVLQFVGESVPCSKITAVEFARRLSDLVSENKIAVEKFLNVAENLYIKRKISMRNYVEITGPLLRSDAVSMNAILKEFTNFEKQRASKSELADGLVQYFMNYCEDTDELQKLYRENNLIPYPYLLRSVYSNIRGINESDKCLEWFKDIIVSQSSGEQLQKDVNAIGNDQSGEQVQKDVDAVGNDKSRDELPKDVDAIGNDKSGEQVQKDVDAIGNGKSGEQEQKDVDAIGNDKNGEQLQKGVDAIGNDQSGKQVQSDVDAIGNDKNGEQVQKDVDVIGNDQREQLQKDVDAIGNDKVLSFTFVKSLFIGVAAKSIETSECADILLNSRQGNDDKLEKDTSAMSTDERKVTNEQIEEVLVIFSEKNIIPWNTYADILYCGLEKNLIKESSYLKHLQRSKAKNQIEFSLYIDQLKLCIVNQKMSQQLVEETLTKHIEDKEWDKKKWITLFVDMARQNVIPNALKLILFHCTTKTYKMNEEELKSIVKSTEISKEERHRILSGVKTHGRFGSSKVKGK